MKNQQKSINQWSSCRCNIDTDMLRYEDTFWPFSLRDQSSSDQRRELLHVPVRLHLLLIYSTTLNTANKPIIEVKNTLLKLRALYVLCWPSAPQQICDELYICNHGTVRWIEWFVMDKQGPRGGWTKAGNVKSCHERVFRSRVTLPVQSRGEMSKACVLPVPF